MTMFRKLDHKCSLFLGALAGLVLAAPAALGDSASRGALVAVAGASGRTGQHVVEQLVARNYRVRALVRDAARGKDLFPGVVEVVTADVRDPAALGKALKGARFLISAVGAGGMKPEPGNGPEEIDFQGVANLANAAKAARLRQVVLVSSAAVTKAESYPLAFMRPILAAKFKGEQALRASRVPYTIVRPGGLIDEPGGRSAVTFMQGDQALGRIPRADVATVCVEALGRKSALYKTLEIVSGKQGESNDWARDFAALARDAK
jgi:uncharacterized protein YbjT (DUF2867 family)